MKNGLFLSSLLVSFNCLAFNCDLSDYNQPHINTDTTPAGVVNVSFEDGEYGWIASIVEYDRAKTPKGYLTKLAHAQNNNELGAAWYETYRYDTVEKELFTKTSSMKKFNGDNPVYIFDGTFDDLKSRYASTTEFQGTKMYLYFLITSGREAKNYEILSHEALNKIMNKMTSICN